MKRVSLDRMLTEGVALLIIGAIFLVGGYGYVHNIYSLITNMHEAAGMVVVRAVGIFVAPLGIILGLFF